MTRPALLDTATVDAALAAAGSPWARDGDKLRVEFQFPTFMDAIGFVVTVAENAERLNHHPDIDVRYTTVRLVVSTHDQGGLTELDLQLAEAASAAAADQVS
ncbi:MAG TPA: 4a-hydroxytetrahydrobiopterin dehydratase [Acidimicrobiales bacterium]|jgi:4a-hydroxytetrahydrobiopterin dehydratase|nr:4a-hydroxytetrahydrobiopterin dehydratase [Acidimicrobiales bacterium]